MKTDFNTSDYSTPHLGSLIDELVNIFLKYIIALPPKHVIVLRR